MVVQPFDSLCVFFFGIADNPYCKGRIMTRSICYDFAKMVVICWLYLIFNYNFPLRIRFFCKNIDAIPSDIGFRLYKLQIDPNSFREQV